MNEATSPSESIAVSHAAVNENVVNNARIQNGGDGSSDSASVAVCLSQFLTNIFKGCIRNKR